MLSRLGLGVARSNRQLLRVNTRLISTVKASHNEEQSILVEQRKRRPLSPDLAIYKPQLTWILSSGHRISGVAMAAAFYGLTVAYAVSSITGTFAVDAVSIASSFAALPVAAKVGAKALMAYPFAYHSFNGVRHLVWDFGKELTIKGVYRTGYIMLAATAVFGSYLTFF